MPTSTPQPDKPAAAPNGSTPAAVPGVLGKEFTDGVIASIGPGASPRLREVMTGLIRHVHDFAREVRLTHPEWLAAVDLINRAGRMSDGKRNEGQLLCDVIGLESWVSFLHPTPLPPQMLPTFFPLSFCLPSIMCPIRQILTR